MIARKDHFINVSSLGELAEYGIERAAVAIGVFDGVHKGHQLLIKELLEMTAGNGAAPVAVTFFPHPRAVLKPEGHPGLLISPEKRIELLHSHGIKAVVTIPFTREFASLEPELFIKHSLISSNIELKGICVGAKWRFGAGGRGGSDTLKKFASAGHFEFRAVRELVIDGEEVSSTGIRHAVFSGLLGHAGKMLGRNYSLAGRVESGRHLAGPELEHPTANIKIEYGIIPPNGVYAAFTEIEGYKYPVAVAVGVSPTFNYANNTNPRVEAHVIGFQGDLYGKKLEAVLLEYLREERSYSRKKELKEQILLDVIRCRNIFREKGL
jgi:riboflavin kinase/FMN adenylyltransferase